MSKIVSLTVSNFKRISAAHIEPDGSVVILGGANEAGKTSVLDAIMAALAGGRAIPTEPVRRGAVKGSVEVDLGDVVIVRTFTPSGGSLKVRTKDGANYSRAQSWLDARIGDLSCDPLAFMREAKATPKKAAERLRRIVGVDTSALDVERAQVYDERRDIGRDVKRERGAAESMPCYPDAPAEEVEPQVVSAAALLAEVREAEETVRRVEQAQGDIERVEATVQHWQREEARLLEALAEARRNTRRATEPMEEAKANLERARQTVIDPAPLRDQLDSLEQSNEHARAEAEGINRQVRANRAREAQQRRAEAAQATYDARTARIEAIDEERRAMLAAAEFPVPGLSFDEAGGITYQGLPLEQASGAVQIRVSMAVALAANPEIRVVLIRDASLLDEGNMKLIAEMAEEHGAQVWLERVGDRDEGAVVIEDGQIRGEG